MSLKTLSTSGRRLWNALYDVGKVGMDVSIIETCSHVAI